MSRETALWRYIKRGMANRWDACRHEDSATVGVPDVSYGARGVQGWIELKAIDAWPRNAGTAVRVRHFTAWQKRWLLGRGQRGGRAWLLLKVLAPRTFLLFSWDKAPYVGAAARDDLTALACKVWLDKIDWNEFERVITK